jgi:CRISPR/Cas system endoribonuclease Cas6 (RAMP superfamily)
MFPNYRLLGVLQTNVSQVVPWNYRELIQGWIYKNLGQGKEKIHKAPYSLFTFSFTTPVYEFDENGLKAETWCLRIASAHQQLLEALEIKLKKGLRLDSQFFSPVMVTREILTEQNQFVSDPILVLSQDGSRFLDPFKDANFDLAVTVALQKRWEYFTEQAAPEIKFNYTTKPRIRKAEYKNRTMLAFQGDVVLDTTSEMLNFAQCVGLGNKPSCGLGMVV